MSEKRYAWVRQIDVLYMWDKNVKKWFMTNFKDSSYLVRIFCHTWCTKLKHA